MGNALYLAKGCSACHGQDANGTAIAPALQGKSAEQVRNQVRSPVGNMPAFTTDQVTDAELDKIAAFFASLAADAGQVGS